MSIFEGKPLKELAIHYNDDGDPESVDLITSAGVLTISDPNEIDAILQPLHYAVEYNNVRTRYAHPWKNLGAYMTWYITKILEW